MKGKTEKIILFSGVLLIVVLLFLIVWNAGIFGISKSRVEQDARENQKIDSSWQLSQATNENMCAMLFYDETTNNCVYSIYLKRDGFSFGYFFRDGGINPYIQDSVHGIVYEDRGIALLSLNEDQVSRIVVDNTMEEKTIDVNPQEPFVVVLPVNCGEITMYDAQGNVVTLYDTYM